MNSDVKKYINSIKMLFPILRKEERLFLKSFSETIIKEANNEFFSYQDCIDKFGTPHEVLSSYYEEIDTNILINKVKNQHMLKQFFYSLIIAIIIISFVACTLLHKSYNDVKQNHVSNPEISIEIVK